MRAAIEDAIPGAKVEVHPVGPGHFAIQVVAEAFRGRSTLQQHQSVYAAIAPLMQGDAPPVHAVDQLVTRLP
jgi:stress-induced morphogen